ncbi:MAG: hypothetical protein K2G23_05295, partial [Muribaculaceae bacterium]|nr:hypothetical protein [Muribaculaceae bacterium]
MKTTYTLVLCAASLLGLAACQDKSYDVIDPIIAPASAESITGEMVGDDYVWSWSNTGNLSMEVTVIRDGVSMGKSVATDGKYVHSNVETKVPYSYVFKLTDGTNYSTGVIKQFLRNGADPVSDIMMSQVEKGAGYDALVEWVPSKDATQVSFTATSGSRTVSETLDGKTSSYTIPNVTYGEEWSVTIVASNSDGKSLPANGSLKIGKTAVGFLSEYPTEAELLANGDDDEACAWLWMKAEYPNAAYIYFGDIASIKDLEPYRVLFWMRDLEENTEDDVFNMPEVVNAATPIVREWYKE